MGGFFISHLLFKDGQLSVPTIPIFVFFTTEITAFFHRGLRVSPVFSVHAFVTFVVKVFLAPTRFC
jgi:hypothetical protein